MAETLYYDDDEDKEYPDYRMEALVELREQLTDFAKPQTDIRDTLLESVDIALNKLINEQIINPKPKTKTND